MARWSKVEISGVNTSTLPVLSRDEAKALFIEAKAGSESARQTLIQGNLRLVLSVIKKFDGRNEKPGRSVSGRVHWTHQGNRQLQPGHGRLPKHLSSTHDPWGSSPLPP